MITLFHAITPFTTFHFSRNLKKFFAALLDSTRLTKKPIENANWQFPQK